MGRKAGRNPFWRFVDNLEGDKAVWMIALLLMGLSISYYCLVGRQRIPEEGDCSGSKGHNGHD